MTTRTMSRQPGREVDRRLKHVRRRGRVLHQRRQARRSRAGRRTHQHRAEQQRRRQHEVTQQRRCAAACRSTRTPRRAARRGRRSSALRRRGRSPPIIHAAPTADNAPDTEARPRLNEEIASPSSSWGADAGSTRSSRRSRSGASCCATSAGRSRIDVIAEPDPNACGEHGLELLARAHLHHLRADLAGAARRVGVGVFEAHEGDHERHALLDEQADAGRAGAVEPGRHDDHVHVAAAIGEDAVEGVVHGRVAQLRAWPVRRASTMRARPPRNSGASTSSFEARRTEKPCLMLYAPNDAAARIASSNVSDGCPGLCALRALSITRVMRSVMPCSDSRTR